MSDYPIRPVPDNDPRFLGLTTDVARVLEAHGFPPVTDFGDLADLQQALYRFLYVGNEGGQS
ncbi:hypothetical protein PV703_15595 [Streptomyces sp. ME01-24h]|nr:hypothetical protein [Streptomyces sp. ME01-24h]